MALIVICHYNKTIHRNTYYRILLTRLCIWFLYIPSHYEVKLWLLDDAMHIHMAWHDVFNPFLEFLIIF